ncbi:hypothetical protein C0993_007791, partial [Termitomyces sp. T159_Od127]
MLTPIADAFLASASFIAHANLLLAQVQGLGAEAPCNKAPAAPSFDEELEALLAGEEPLVVSTATKGFGLTYPPVQEVAKKSEADAQRRIANSLEALACEGLGLEEATGAGKGSQQRQEEEEEEEGTKEKTPDTMAGAAMGAARKASAGDTKRLALPTKKGSPTKPASKCRGCPMPRYEAPTQQDFSNKELARLLVPRQAEAVVDRGVEAGVVLKEIKGKVTVDLATRQAFKEEQGVIKVESEGDKEDEVRCIGVAIEASKAAPGVEDLAGSSCQAEVPQDISTLHKEMEQNEEEAKVRPKAAPQAQPWGWGSPQWSWLPEWGANDPATWDVSSGNKPESWEPRRRVMAR